MKWTDKFIISNSLQIHSNVNSKNVFVFKLGLFS